MLIKLDLFGFVRLAKQKKALYIQSETGEKFQEKDIYQLLEKNLTFTFMFHKHGS